MTGSNHSVYTTSVAAYLSKKNGCYPTKWPKVKNKKQINKRTKTSKGELPASYHGALSRGSRVDYAVGDTPLEGHLVKSRVYRRDWLRDWHYRGLRGGAWKALCVPFSP